MLLLTMMCMHTAMVDYMRFVAGFCFNYFTLMCRALMEESQQPAKRRVASKSARVSLCLTTTCFIMLWIRSVISSMGLTHELVLESVNVWLSTFSCACRRGGNRSRARMAVPSLLLCNAMHQIVVDCCLLNEAESSVVVLHSSWHCYSSKVIATAVKLRWQ